MSTIALHGGHPVRERMLPYGRQWITQEDIDQVVAVLRSDWLTTGPRVTAFEQAFAQYVGAQHAVAVSNGTAALHAALFAAGIGPGDEVIVPAMTFAASASCVRFVGAKVVFADIRADTMTLDPQATAAAITPQTRAILPVDFMGQPAQPDVFVQLAHKHQLTMVSDACHALGATYQGHRIGSIADLTAFSFHPVKHITAGEGGMITTNNAAWAERMRCFRHHGITIDHHQRNALGSWFYEIRELGYNYRLTDIQCALGQSQLKKLPDWLARRRAIAARYNTALAAIPEIEIPTVLPDSECAWHLYIIRLRLERLKVDRREIFKALRAENIGVSVHYIPVPWHPYYQQLGYRKGSWPVAEQAYERMLSLPIFPLMSDADIDDVITACERVMQAFRK